MATADMILGNLERQAPRAQEPQAVAPTPRAESTLSEMIQQVAERILVGESGPGGQQEVRILLKDDVLGGTEIRMHEEGGALHLTFVAATKDVENFLGDRQQQIANALGERLDREIRVGVTDRDGAMSQQVEQRNTSDQPNDGRSRNRRFVQDERED
jgi:type III secretion system needle length determinant